jgi:hypothetical protein
MGEPILYRWYKRKKRNFATNSDSVSAIALATLGVSAQIAS